MLTKKGRYGVAGLTHLNLSTPDARGADELSKAKQT